MAEIFCQLKEIETVVDTGLHLGEVEKVFFDVCAGKGVAVPSLVNLKFTEDEWVGDSHQGAFHATGTAREGGDFPKLTGQDHDALVILSDRRGG